MKTPWIAMVIILCCTLAGCSSNCTDQPTAAEKAGIAAYEKLPASSRTVLEDRADLKGFSYYTVVSTDVDDKESVSYVTTLITSRMLDSGAFRADSNKTADLLFTLTPPPFGSKSEVKLAIEMKDKRGNVLLSNNGEDFDLRQAIDEIITALGTERRNKALAKK